MNCSKYTFWYRNVNTVIELSLIHYYYDRKCPHRRWRRDVMTSSSQTADLNGNGAIAGDSTLQHFLLNFYLFFWFWCWGHHFLNVSRLNSRVRRPLRTPLPITSHSSSLLPLLLLPLLLPLLPLLLLAHSIIPIAKLQFYECLHSPSWSSADNWYYLQYYYYYYYYWYQ